MNLTGAILRIKRKHYSMVEPESMVLHGNTACEIEQLIEQLRTLSESTTSDAETAEIYSLIYRLNAEKNEAKRLKSTSEIVCGFVPLSEGIESTPPPAPHNGLIPTDTSDFQGVINSILTTDKHIPDNKGYESERLPTDTKLRRKNRKYATHKDTMLIDGEEYKINVTARSGVFTKIIYRAHSELQWLIAKVKRVHIHIFDLHHAGLHTLDNKRISRLLKNAGRRIKRHYGTEYMGYLWVREQERGKAQHYHFMVFIDGKKAQHPHFIREAFKQEWFNICGGTLSYPKRCYYNLNSRKPDFQKIKADIIYRISYRAKQRGKGYRPPQTKDYNTSRLSSPVNGG